jgi:hypothetical protein
MIPSDAQWIDEDGTLDPAIFYRRRIDKDGVSVTTEIRAGLERMKRVGRGVEGVLSLHVGWVRNIDRLDVTRRHAADTHAIIKGLPYSDADPKEAERLATELLEIARDAPLP